ncbi:non-homologous end-joining DNA ligase [Pseudomonas aeruginosa]|uniref:non-homologous end-joining DNA ligase n=1 Tax=Pseudomonas aeruginosa TaxID=287 RepID=UPI000708AFDE|nr:non-homologous end-joining DNA ligase [Pseudomonas aeruginosa]
MNLFYLLGTPQLKTLERLNAMASKKGATPRRIQPQLVTLVGRPPSGDWLFETKFGYRLMARLDAGVTLITKNGYDWTNRMPSLAQELSGLPVRGVWLDGEIVALDVEGRPAFQPLQLAFSQRQTDDLIYFAFDLLYMDGTDLRPWPVEQRRELLQILLQQCDLEHVRFSPTLEADPASLLASACQLGLEGLVGKRRGSAYSGQRNGDWVKLKCNNRQEFVVLGYTRAGAGIGSLLIGLHDDDGQLQYAGRVHSGFGGRQADQLHARLRHLQRDGAPVTAPPSLKGASVVWVTPELVAEVKFLEITPSGKVRHAVFLGLREDKPAAGISLESNTDL